MVLAHVAGCKEVGNWVYFRIQHFMFFYFRNITPLSIPLSVNGSIVSFWQWPCSAFTLCFSVVFTWIACFFLLLCLRPAELICCKRGSPLVAGVAARSWKMFVVVGFMPTSLLGFNASPFLAFAVAGLMVFPTSPRARRGVAKGALSDWKDFLAPKLLPVYQYLDINVVRCSWFLGFNMEIHLQPFRKWFC